MRRGAALLVAAGLAVTTITAATAAAAGPPLRITSLRVTKPDGRTPARQPLARGGHYAYRLDYRVGGRSEATITRNATWLSPYGDVLSQIRPPSQIADPGRLFASGPIHVTVADSPGEYQLRYSVTATGRSGATARQATLRVRFR